MRRADPSPREVLSSVYVCVSLSVWARSHNNEGACARVELLQYNKKTRSRTGYLAQVLMGQYEMALNIWGEVVHWIQISGRSL